MAEVTSRGGGLPRGTPHRTRGRGRGRGASNSTLSGSHPTVANGLDHHKMNGRSSHPDRSSNHHPVGNQDEPEELKLIRKKHGHNLATIRELFPNWTDEDLLMALNEASGDLELAAARISEGLAEKWGSVKTKKDKKTSSPVLPSSQPPRGQGAPNTNVFEGRGGRGRSDVPRGSARGGGRGAAPRGVGRGQPFTNVSRGTHPTADEPSIATTTPTSWSLAVTASHNEASNSSGPSASLATIGNELGQSVDLEPTNQSIGALPSEEAKPESNHPPRDGNLNGLVEPPKFTSELAKKPISRVIAPGTKMSWAQIARPVEPPKPPVAPAAPAQPSISTLSGTDGNSDVAKEAAQPEALAAQTVADSQLHDGQVPITIPDSTADVWHTEPVPAIEELKTNISGTGPNVWNDDPVLQPLGVGEAWAEAVLAQPNESTASIFDQQAASKLGLTPSEAPNIGPIEMSTPSASAPVLEPTMAPPANVTDRALQVPAETPSIMTAASIQSTPLPPSSSILAPPGLTKRASTRKGQEAAVVMPGSGTPSMDRMGLKFGSLSLFGEAAETGEAAQAPPLDAPSPPVPIIEEPLAKEAILKPDDSQVEKSLTPQPTNESVKSPSPPAPPQVVEELPIPPQPSQQSAQSAQHVQPQPLNPPAAAAAAPAPVPTSTAPPHSSSFNSRYQSNNQYAAAEPNTVQPANASSQAPQPQQQDAFSHYSGFRQDPMTAYFQQQQQQQQSTLAQHSTSPIPASQTPAAYGTFNHMNQQVPQQGQQPAQTSFGQAPQSVPDYAAIYGQEALRSLGYYDSYAHAQAAQAAFQNRSPHGGADDSSKSSASVQTAPPPGQPQQVGHHQHHHPPQPSQQQQQQPAGTSVSTATQQYPGMQPSPMPYPYYPYYQQYGQLPPNYQNPAYPYALQAPSPYYSVQGSQQYQAASTRAGQSQYPMQGGPGNSVTAGPNALPISHAHQQQHATQHGLGGAGVVANNAGFRQVSQPGVSTSQIPNGQVAGQGIVGGNSGLVGSGGSSGMPSGQQPSSMHQQHAYYGSGYGGYGGDPQQNQQGGGGMGGSANSGHHHHHHHHQAQQQHVSRQAAHHQHSHHAGGGPAGASGGQGANERKDPFTFASDRFFNQ
ncbi:hypothetical protein PCANC_01504 [Puccinia coronata f. sp. avenae]|uniref:RNA polymerase II degradation factor 1 n=1 Tax=Puccinia coronata f. sp. avenae TaxID=200324 RepID=A0A2N5SMW7_9BASI|nr:hypothetical protein PCASD_20187 [Puccinia coronata f. sp. avenae]PLW56546.1 hypothetical protein PCANC_01504 [Puccinia coronata f. sp. avenae]